MCERLCSGIDPIRSACGRRLVVAFCFGKRVHGFHIPPRLLTGRMLLAYAVAGGRCGIDPIRSACFRRWVAALFRRRVRASISRLVCRQVIGWCLPTLAGRQSHRREIVQRHRSHPLCLCRQVVGGCHVWQACARLHIPPRLLTGRMLLPYFGRWPISQA